MPDVFTAARVITPDEDLVPGWVLVNDGKIDAVGAGHKAREGLTVTDLGPLTLVPGFVDVHVHGGGGFSLLSGAVDEAGDYLRWAVTGGVTALMPAVCAASPDDALLVLQALSSLRGISSDGAEVLGVNLEGPFVSPERMGALPPSWAHPPDVDLLDRLADAAAGSLRLITIAPELEGAQPLIEAARALGITVAVGHSEAGFQAAAAAFRAGASHVTHALNAMRPFHQRDPGVVGAALDAPAVTIEVIADGVHLHPATVRLLVSGFGPDRVALVTDAVAPAGLDKGTFQIGVEEAVLKAGRITLADGTLAGSAATMDMLLRNVVNWGVADLRDAVRMAATVPARVAGAGDRKGRIADGYDADLVALTPEFEVAATWIRGQLVYSTPGLSLTS